MSCPHIGIIRVPLPRDKRAKTLQERPYKGWRLDMGECASQPPSMARRGFLVRLTQFYTSMVNTQGEKLWEQSQVLDV